MTTRFSTGPTQALGAVPERDPASQGDATPSRPLPSTTRSAGQDPTTRQMTPTAGCVPEESVPRSGDDQSKANARRIDGDVLKEEVPRSGRGQHPPYVVIHPDDLEEAMMGRMITRNIIQHAERFPR